MSTATATDAKPKPIAFPSGMYFVANRAQVTETLFRPRNGTTASGHYKREANGIRFYNLQGEPSFFLVANRHGERFFVSCTPHKGQVFYSFALSIRDEKRLGLDALNMSQENEFAASIWEAR